MLEILKALPAETDALRRRRASLGLYLDRCELLSDEIRAQEG
jgi:hypothetical protein